MSEISPKPRVQPGSCVEIRLLSRSGEGERLEFDLVLDEQADYQSGFLGIGTALAQAILGEEAGITVPYFTDELMAIEIISIRESTRNAAGNAAVQREAALKDARDQIEFTNAALCATAMNTKWGAYDADGLDFEEWKSRQSEKFPATGDDGEV